MNARWLSEAVESLRPAVPAGSQIIVFGSYARGDAGATAISICWSSNRKWLTARQRRFGFQHFSGGGCCRPTSW